MSKTLLFSSPDSSIDVPDDRPSERPTRPTLPPPEDPSDESLDAIDSVTELTESDFVDDEDAIPLVSAKAITSRPAPNVDDRAAPRSPRRRRPSWLGSGLRITAASLLFVTACFILLDSPSDLPPSRSPRVAWPERNALAEPAVASRPVPAARACIVSGAARFVAPRALINPGLDVSSSPTGFVVSLASSNDEASAVRLEGTSLRTAENVRLRPNANAPIRHVVARDTGDGAADFLDVHADADEARTVIPEGESPAFRVGLAGAFVVARAGDRMHSLWPSPLPPKDRRVDALRVAPRDDGGAAVVLKRGSTLYFGLVNGALAPTGPLLTIVRTHATVGTPFIVANGGGAAIAWAERADGARDWTVVVASLGGGEMETKTIGAGMSPSLGVLPDGTLVVAYADGPAASHRIVVRRLAADLAPTGDLVVASPEGVNAGQPVVDVRADGRALVAWLAVSRGQPASVFATPLECDVTSSM